MDAADDANAAVAASPTDVLAPPGVDPRRWHYREFYGLVEAPAGAGVVLGNCQAESVRLVIDRVAAPTVRVPAVHELEPEDVPHLDRLLASAAFVVTQPIRSHYRALPVGTAQVRDRVPSGCRVVTLPNVRFAGLHPFQAALRVPGVDEDPPVVAYHDVRWLAHAAGQSLPDALAPQQLHRVTEDSLAELRRREQAHDTTVVASDLFDRPTFEHMRTVNHAGNPVWLALGGRVLEALGSDEGPHDPGRPLLDSVQAPREQWVADAWDIDGARREWVIDGEHVEPEVIREAQEAWYRAHPQVVAGAMTRLAPTIARWAAA